MWTICLKNCVHKSVLCLILCGECCGKKVVIVSEVLVESCNDGVCVFLGLVLARDVLGAGCSLCCMFSGCGCSRCWMFLAVDILSAGCSYHLDVLGAGCS